LERIQVDHIIIKEIDTRTKSSDDIDINAATNRISIALIHTKIDTDLDTKTKRIKRNENESSSKELHHREIDGAL